MNVTCTPDERRLIVGGATRLVVPGDPVPRPFAGEQGRTYELLKNYIAPQRWVDATGPCPHDQWGMTTHCPDCIDGRKRVALAVTKFGVVSGRSMKRLVVFAHATVEVLPVVDYDDSKTRPILLQWGTRSIYYDGEWERDLTLDPLPVPSRDFVVLLDNVEMEEK